MNINEIYRSEKYLKIGILKDIMIFVIRCTFDRNEFVSIEKVAKYVLVKNQNEIPNIPLYIEYLVINGVIELVVLEDLSLNLKWNTYFDITETLQEYSVLGNTV